MTPLFSVCIPQHNRTSFLLEALRSLSAQTFRDFEVCVSDDCSTDGREEEILDFLRGAGFPFTYRRQEKNLRYDGNLRSSIALANGEYCFLLGNDDCLADVSSLEGVAREIKRCGPVGIAITNYRDFSSGKQFRRVTATGIAGSGPEVAAGIFRNMSFVSGVVLRTSEAKRHATCAWDGSEMYQMFIGSRIIAAGGAALTVDQVVIRCGIDLPGEHVDSYASREPLRDCLVTERRIPLGVLPRLVIDAIAPYLPVQALSRVAEKVFFQVYLFTYPFWIVEYRRVQSWQFALGICFGMRPHNVIGNTALAFSARVRLILLYAVVTAGGLLVPQAVFQSLRGFFYRLAKRKL